MSVKATDPKEQIMTAAAVVSGAAALLRQERPTIEQFLTECRNMDNFGSVISPSLFRDPERRAVSATIKPIFESALAFLRAHDEQVRLAGEALANVGRCK